MKLTQIELQRLLELVLNANMHQQSVELHEKLLSKLSVEFAKKTIEKDPIVETMEPTYKVGDFHFTSSTTETARKLHVTQSDLRVLRSTNELREKLHYETGKSPRPTAIWYDLNRTCLQLHEVDYETFSQPGFDVQENTNRRVTRAFARAREGMKK